MCIPKDAILILSGVSCVGKTTTAYEILKNYPEFRRVDEYDLIRAVVRTSYEHLLEDIYSNADELRKEYNSLFASITNSNFDITKAQSEQLIPYIKEIILRQQRRRIPTIIEGTGIVPSTYFPNNKPLEWLTKHVVFVNLYISDENEHIFRRQTRSVERDYHESISKTRKNVLQARTEKNQLLHIQAMELHKIFNNVISIDVSNYTSNGVADKVMEFVCAYFSANI